VRVGIAQDRAKSMVKLIKDSKAQAEAPHPGRSRYALPGEKDDLQRDAAVRKSVTDLPLQFINLRD